MTSYEAGSAHLTILPSTRGFAKRLKAELSGVKQDVTVQAKVDVDRKAIDGLNKALNALPIMVLDADSRPADREIAALRDRLATLTDQRIGIDISGDQARAEVAAIKEDLARISAPVIKIDADIKEATGKADELKRRVTEMNKAISADTPQVDLDIRAAEAKAQSIRARIEELSAKKATPQVEAQIATAEAQLGRVTAQLDALNAKKVSPEVRANAAAAEAELARVQGQITALQAQRAEVEVHADTAGAQAALAGVEVALSRVDGQRVTAHADVDTGAALASLGTLALGLDALNGKRVSAHADVDVGSALGSITALTAKLFAIGGAVGGISSVAAAILALGPAAAVAGGGIGAMVLAFGGIGKALTALGAQQDAAGKTAQQSAQQQAQAARQIESAQLQVTRTAQASSQARSDAAQSVSRAEQQSAQQIASAQKSAASAIATADKQAETAHRTLAQATRDLEREQRTLTTAWTAGSRALQDLQDQVDGNALDQRQAAFDLADAKKELDEARGTGDTDQIARAQLAYDKQLEKIDQLNKQTQRLGEDNKAAQAKGVAGTEQYQSALDRVSQAAQRQQDAIRGVRDADAAASAARIDGAASVAAAEEAGRQRVADAVEQGRRQVASADQAAADAQRALQTALSQTATTADTAGDAVRTAFANLSPAAAAFAMYLWSLKPALDQLRATAASGLFPPLQAGLQVLMGQFSVFNTVVGQFAAATGNALGFVLTQLASPFWVSFFSTLGNVAGPIMMQLAVVTMEVAQAVGGLILALLPFTPAAVSMLSLVAQLVAAWTPFIAMFVGQLLPIFPMLIQALMPLGAVLGALSPILAVLGQAFSMVLGAVLQALVPVLVALTPLIQQLAMAFATQLVATIQAATPFLVGLATWLSQNPGLVMGVITAIGALAAAFGPLMSIVGMLGHVFLALQLRSVATGLLGAGSAAGSAGGSVGLLGRMFSFLTGPVGIVIGLFAALFASNEQFRGAVMNLLGVLGGVLMQVLQALMPVFNALVGVVNLIMGALGQLLSQVAQALVPVLNMFAGLIGQLAQALLPPLMSVITSLLPVFDLLGQIVGQVFAALQPMMGAWMSMITAIFPVLVQVLQSVVIPVLTFLAKLLAGELSLVISYVLIPAMQALVWVLSNVLVPVVTFVANMMAAAWRGIGAVLLWLWQSVFVPAWNAIATVVSWAWTNILQPIISAIWTGLQYLGAILFTIIVAPFIIAWNLISAAVSWAWTNVLQPIWQAIVWFAQNVLGPVITWLYTNVVKPIWDAIGAAISFVWNSIILPVWNALVWYINNVTIPVMQFLYYNIIKPIWDAIGAAISFVWNYVILPIWNALVWTINNVLIPATQFLYNNVIKPIWDAIGFAIMWVWTNVIQPAFNAVWGGLQWLGDRFRDGVGFIQRIWDTIRGILARPINFMINTVWNNGILTAWNKVAGLIGIPAIAPLAPIAEMATGGPVRGPGSGTSDDVPIWASNGEFMVREKIASRAAPFLAALNAGDGEALQAAGATRAGRSGMFHGRSGLGMNPNAPIPAYRNGGPIFASGAGMWGSAGRYALGGPIEERINAAKSWLSGPARGIPYVWGGGSMSGMDCSGMQAAVTHILSGRPPTSGRIGTTASMPWGGFVPGIEGQYAIGNKPSDHMAATLAGQNVEQHGPSGTPFRFPSRWGADASYFPQKFHLAEVGGNFASGGGGGGSWFNPLPGLVRAAFALTDIPLNIFKGVVGDPPPEWKRVPVGLAFKVRDSLRDFALQKAEMAGPSGSEDVTGISGPVVDQVRQVAARYGWDQGPQWDAIFKIVQKESSWNPGAASPISSARGLFQKMTSLNGPVEPTPAGQAAWGLSYIQRRYGTPTAAWAWHQCLTMDAMLLTRSGWKSYDEIVVGDETIGYNLATGRSEWTRVTATHRYDDAPVVELRSSKWHSRSTPNHRWLSNHQVQRRRGEPAEVVEKFVTTEDITSRHTLRLAAAADTDGELPITEQEAELLGWVMGDGTVSCGQVRVYQGKAHHVETIDKLLAGTPHSRHTYPQNGPDRLPMNRWVLTPTYGRDLLARSRYLDGPVEFVLALDPAQRAAFLRGVIGAEGGTEYGPWSPAGGMTSFSQSDGPKQDAMMLAVYLEGHRPAFSTYDHRGDDNPIQATKPGKTIRLARPWAGGQSLRKTRLENQAVWCVTTELGTFTARQDDQVFLTGNSHNWYDDGGMAYGRGLMLKNTDAPERVLPPQETQAYPTLTRLTQQLEAGRVPTASLTNAAAQARSAARGFVEGGSGLGDVYLYDQDGSLLARMRAEARDEVVSQFASAADLHRTGRRVP